MGWLDQGRTRDQLSLVLLRTEGEESFGLLATKKLKKQMKPQGTVSSMVYHRLWDRYGQEEWR